ncbi:endoribonuclease Dicer-like [Photinus pyralis]|uniref:endoribonuclease Dicer-like n=1 Tax=Photinus pyralis TaxID=7054 RepID=UPI0012674FAE|nr:endoribonuclease Dicer-like [Photinus pyralis]
MDLEMELQHKGKDDFIPRDYQLTIMEIGIKRNSIIFLPTGTGKTLIAVMILKRLAEPLQRPLSQGGKVSVMLVTTVALVDQQSKYLKALTDQDVAAYSGDMNVDYWSDSTWRDQLEHNQVLVMTTQILVNILQRSLLSLNDVNLLIFDECHNGVGDHPMTQVMSYYPNLRDPPRVIGLSATLLNRKCTPAEVLKEVSVLERTFHSKVVTVPDLECLTGYSTNPQEEIRVFSSHTPSEVDGLAIRCLKDLISVVKKINVDKTSISPPKPNLHPLNNDSEFKEVIYLINDVVHHIQYFGSYCGEIAAAAHIIQLERIRKHCQDERFRTAIDAVKSTFQTVRTMYQIVMKSTNQPERIYKFSSPHVNKLFHVLEEYDHNAKVPLCGIIFVQRRFTAKVIYNVLKDLKETDPRFSFINPNFIVGFNVNAYNNTREGLYTNKMNKIILHDFKTKKVNLLVASNVLEEGVDIPTCTLVVKFCAVTNYCAYIQSKGRARHLNSLYYMLVNEDESNEFFRSYQKFQKVEDILNLHLHGNYQDAEEPIGDADQLDGELIPPYYVDGPDSPQVNFLTAIPLLCLYCSHLPADKYTTYTPNWFVDKCPNTLNYRVTIELPPVSGVLDPIEGPFTHSKKLAKRAAALETCKILHQRGELDNKLLPRNRAVAQNNFGYYFNHWPKIQESDVGKTNKQRLYTKRIPNACKGCIIPNKEVYLHIIELQPIFSNKGDLEVIYNLYQSHLCYGFLSAQRLPKLCQFLLYVSAGEILVNLKLNYKQVTLTEENISHLKDFHHLVFRDVLRILKTYLVLDNDDDTNGFLIVPVKRISLNFEIDFENSIKHKAIRDPKAEPTEQMKLSLNVTKENYCGSVITPWYRKDDHQYLVIKVSDELNPLSAFPTEGFATYAAYFMEKHKQTIINKSQPLVLVKGMSKRLNCLKPRRSHGRKSSGDKFEQYLIPELCVKQDFPSALWLQAGLLPTILNRIVLLLQADELRSLIAKGIGLGIHELSEKEEWAPLLLDKHITDDIEESAHYEEIEESNITEISQDKIFGSISLTKLLPDLTIKELAAECPWNELTEPVDIERQRDVKLTDVEAFDNFVSQALPKDHQLAKNKVANRNKCETDNNLYTYKPLNFLKIRENSKGAELVDIFTALTTAKNNDIVNLERLETLGDSFLKFTISLFLFLKYPSFDEGMLTSFKGKLISNKNLFYIGNKKGISEYVKVAEFDPTSEWKHPHLMFLKYFVHSNSAYSFLDQQVIRDKSIADCIEALLGVYFQAHGIKGGLRFLKWLNIVPQFENIDNMFQMTPPNPAFAKDVAKRNIEYHIPAWEKVQDKLRYTFKNRAYLLQALTHASYISNSITNCYQTLEFLGDAVLDFLITCYIFEASENLSPGDLTDLRSALVNNITFACFTVRCGFQKHLQFSNRQLSKYIDNFVRYQELNNHKINEEVLTLISEGELHIGQHIDVPKVLGDMFEALIGAVFLDSGMCLKTTWKVIHRIMWKEMETFMKNVPKQPIRVIHEMVAANPRFGSAVVVDDGHVIVQLHFMLNGSQKVVYGAGGSKASAKKAAAKIALRLLNK